MKKDKKLMLITLTIIIFTCIGCTSTSTGGKAYQECYYGDDGKKCVLINILLKIQMSINGMGGSYV